MTDIIYDKFVYGSELTAEQWSKLQYRPTDNDDLYSIVENPSFGIDKNELINTKIIEYNATEKLNTLWVQNNTDFEKNTWNPETGDGLLYLNSDVTEIGYSAFNWNTYIISIKIPYGITLINNMAFKKCTNLISVELPHTITCIGDEAFCNCNNLTSINFPNSLITIGKKAFEYCTKLNNITFPNSLITIEREAFAWCSSLTSVIVPDSVTSIGEYGFGNCEKIETVYLSNNITIIEEQLFYSAESLVSINIPNKTTTIKSFAFGGFNNKLTTITLPSNVTLIQNNGFSDCPQLSTVFCYAINPPILGDYNFRRNRDTLYVPAESVQAYLADSSWNTAFNGNIQAIPA